MTALDLLGFCAAFLTTISFLPQAVKVLKTRDTAALSLGMYSIFTAGVALWLAYGWLKADKAVFIANLVTLLLAASILAMKLYQDGLNRK